MRHCTMEEVEMLLAGELGSVVAFLRRRHLARCPACAAMLRQAESDNALLKEALEAIRKEEAEHSAAERVADSIAPLIGQKKEN